MATTTKAFEDLNDPGRVTPNFSFWCPEQVAYYDVDDFNYNWELLDDVLLKSGLWKEDVFSFNNPDAGRSQYTQKYVFPKVPRTSFGSWTDGKANYSLMLKLPWEGSGETEPGASFPETNHIGYLPDVFRGTPAIPPRIAIPTTGTGGCDIVIYTSEYNYTNMVEKGNYFAIIKNGNSGSDTSNWYSGNTPSIQMGYDELRFAGGAGTMSWVSIYSRSVDFHIQTNENGSGVRGPGRVGLTVDRNYVGTREFPNLSPNFNAQVYENGLGIGTAPPQMSSGGPLRFYTSGTTLLEVRTFYDWYSPDHSASGPDKIDLGRISFSSTQLTEGNAHWDGDIWVEDTRPPDEWWRSVDLFLVDEMYFQIKSQGFRLPCYNTLSQVPIQVYSDRYEGTLIYVKDLHKICYSDGVDWYSLASQLIT